jgi:hypothetical protein
MSLQKILDSLHIVLVIVSIAAIIFACYGGYNLYQQVTPITSEITKSLKFINKPDSGLLPVTHDAVVDAKNLIGMTGIIVRHEEHQLTTLDKQEAILFNDIHTSLGNVNTLLVAGKSQLDSSTRTTDELTQVLAEAKTTIVTTNDNLNSLTPLLDNLTKTVHDGDVLVSNESIPQIIKNVDKTSAGIATVSTNAALVTSHYENMIDHPKKMSFFEKIKNTGNLAWHIMMLLK